MNGCHFASVNLLCIKLTLINDFVNVPSEGDTLGIQNL